MGLMGELLERCLDEGCFHESAKVVQLMLEVPPGQHGLSLLWMINLKKIIITIIYTT